MSQSGKFEISGGKISNKTSEIPVSVDKSGTGKSGRPSPAAEVVT